MAVIGADVFTGEGNEGTQSQGYYIHVVAPPTSATNVSFSSTGSVGTTISWTSGSSTNSAVFVAAASSGNPTVVANTTYTANTTYGTPASEIGSSGWYCVYNGTGTSVSITGLSPNTTYRAAVVAYSNSSGLLSYDNNTTATNNPNNVTTGTPAIAAPGGTTTVPSATSGIPGSSTSFNITGSNLAANITATAPTNFQVSSDNSTWNSTATIAESGGTLTSTPVYVRLSGSGSVGTQSGNVTLSSTSATSVNQAVSGSILQPTIISPSPTVTLPSTMSGTPGSSASFAFAAQNLSPATGNITVTAPTNVQVSPDNSTWSSSYTQSYSGSNLGPTPVHVRLSGTGTVGTIAGNISLSGGGAATVTQAVSGTLNAASTTISSITLVNASTNNLSSVQYTVTFAASVSRLINR